MIKHGFLLCFVCVSMHACASVLDSSKPQHRWSLGNCMIVDEALVDSKLTRLDAPL